MQRHEEIRSVSTLSVYACEWTPFWLVKGQGQDNPFVIEDDPRKSFMTFNQPADDHAGTDVNPALSRSPL